MDSAPLPQDEKKASLLLHDALFRQLVDEHHSLDQTVKQLATQAHLSVEEQQREADLKKRKLALRDRIEARLRDASLHPSTA
jgi:uncharacterized protein YdcH (DUF465 family)